MCNENAHSGITANTKRHAHPTTQQNNNATTTHTNAKIFADNNPTRATTITYRVPVFHDGLLLQGKCNARIPIGAFRCDVQVVALNAKRLRSQSGLKFVLFLFNTCLLCTNICSERQSLDRTGFQYKLSCGLIWRHTCNTLIVSCAAAAAS